MDAKNDMIFPDQNSTNFPISVKNNLQSIKYDKKEFLKYHQFIVYNYLINNNNARGILLFHDMGFGKSISSIAIAEFYRQYDPDRKIVVLLSKSLQSNFQKNIEKFMSLKYKIKKESSSNLSEEEIDRIIDQKYKFVSLNASNMYTQMTCVNKTKGEIEIEKQIQEFTDVVEKNDFLENSLLIVDEFHNLSNSITNGSYNAIRLYDTILRTKNIKLLFLTGTPIINHPFELVPTFNMLNGLISVDNKVQIPLFPELQKDFNLYFVDKKKNIIKNPEKFKNRIFGLCSYYGNMYFGNKTKDGFPTELPIKVEKIHMSADQYSRYNMARDFEREDAMNKSRRPSKSDRFTTKSVVSTSYRMQSRQISNYLIPEYALGPPLGKKTRNKYINKITDKDLKNLSVFSPKFKKIIENIESHKNQLGLLYSEFVSGEGIAIFAKLLNLKGYTCWNTNNKLLEDADVFDIKHDKECCGKKYALITGDISFDERTKIIKIFNNDNNRTGDKISLLLISKTGAEGLDLKNVRHVHLMEPYWNYARIEQIIARAVRYQSHVSLNIKFRTVQPYMYLSDYPKDFDIKKKKEPTTDVDLYTESIKNKKLINEFYIALADASIDCSLHSPSFSKNIKEKIKCKLCTPNNQKLYHPILPKQILLPNPCKELKTQKIKATVISIPGKDDKYAYSIDSVFKHNYHIYKYDKKINGYILMDPSDPVYSDIMKKLLKI